MQKRKPYPSDLKDEQWEVLKRYVPPPLSGGRPARYERREILNGILYVLRTGCAWRELPHDLPPWTTVYGYLRRWTRQGIWDWMAERLREDARRRLKKKPLPRRRSSTAKR
jgi:putative transposase